MTTPTVTVCIDFRSPKAYLARDPTFALEDELGLAFDWQSARVAPLTRHTPARDEDRGTRHRRIRAEYNERDLRRYAARAGLPMGDIYRNPDSTVADMGLLWSNAQSHTIARRYVDAVFTRYWEEQLDIADAGAIAALLREIGADDDGWSAYVANSGHVALAGMRQRWTEAGVLDVPAYVVEGDVFFGRQHLPMIRWMLTGRTGAPPL